MTHASQPTDAASPAPTQAPAAADAREAAARLDRWFASCPGAAIAFSGGVDSALVAWWARKCLGRDHVSAWVADSPSLKRADLELARRFCADHDIDLRELRTDEIEHEDYAKNAFDRCYHCKSTLYDTLGKALREALPEAWICSGTNLDDRGDYRPGLRAAGERAIRHPLLECGVGKQLVRALAHEAGLALWDKPASPCLSSRLPYGERVTREKLARIEAAEAWLASRGFGICRVRHAADKAVIEVPPADLARAQALLGEADLFFSMLGFAQTTVDPEGFVSGKMNRALPAANTADTPASHSAPSSTTPAQAT